MQITSKNYDLLLKRFSKIDEKLKLKDNKETHKYYPSASDLEIMNINPNRFILLAIYLYEFGNKPETQEEKENKKNLMKFINENLEIV